MIMIVIKVLGPCQHCSLKMWRESSCCRQVSGSAVPSQGRRGNGNGSDSPSSLAPSTGHPQSQAAARETRIHVPISHCLRAGPCWGVQGSTVFSSLSCSPSTLTVLVFCQIQLRNCQKRTSKPLATSTEMHRYLQTSLPGLDLLLQLRQALLQSTRWDIPPPALRYFWISISLLIIKKIPSCPLRA